MMHEFLRSIYQFPDHAKGVYSFVRNDVKGARMYEVPLRTRVKAWRHGFDCKHWVWMDLDENTCKNYVNTVDAIWTIPDLNGHYAGVLDDKIAFHSASDTFSDNLPTLYGVIDEGQFIPQKDKEAIETVIDILRIEDKIVVKPICGTSGQGVYIVEIIKGKYLINGNSVEECELLDLVSGIDDSMVTDYVSQDSYADSIYPQSTNTIRVNTIVDPKTNEPEIVRATHRFGTSKSEPTDNWSRGGMCAPIDVDEGVLKKAIDPHGERSVIKTERHPETDAQIEGVKIPNWNEVCELVQSLAEHHRRAPYTGWDVVISESTPIVIEANANPAIYLPQMERGLLEEDVAKRFFDSLVEESSF